MEARFGFGRCCLAPGGPFHPALGPVMRYDFLIETYRTERIKVLAVWSSFRDDDLPVRPHPTDPRGRGLREQMVHLNRALTVYPYADDGALLDGEAAGGRKRSLPG